jgi:CRP-like cAMP-binding protein
VSATRGPARGAHHQLSTSESDYRDSVLLPLDWILPVPVRRTEEMSRWNAQWADRRIDRATYCSARSRLGSTHSFSKTPSAFDLPLRTVLYEANAPITHVFFLNRAVASIIAPVGDGASVEVGTVGNEGFVGLPLLFGVDREPAKAFIQVADGAIRVTAVAFQSAVTESAALRGLLLRYAQSYMSQVSQSSACNRAHLIEERCARWLLMTHDRVGADEFPLTHEFLSYMLGVRRAGRTSRNHARGPRIGASDLVRKRTFLRCGAATRRHEGH